MITLRTIKDASSWTSRVTLDGTAYVLELNWNGREGAWYLSIADTDGNALLSSRKLSTNWPVLFRFRHLTGLPPGEIMACDASGSIEYAGYSDLGESVSLVYFTDAERAAAGLP